MLGKSHIVRWLSICACAVTLATGTAAPSLAQNSDRIGYFQTPDGSAGFILDRSGETPKQRYDGSPEILLLETSPAARGDTIYRQSDGLIVLRETPFGSLTLFSRRYVKGVAVIRLSGAVSLVSSPRSADEVTASASALAEHLTQTFGQGVTVALPTSPMSPIALGTLDEAIVNTGVAFDRLLTMPAYASGLAGLVHRVEFRVAAKPGGSLTHQRLTIDVAPPLGLNGRLSSFDIGALLSNGITAATASNRDPQNAR